MCVCVHVCVCILYIIMFSLCKTFHICSYQLKKKEDNSSLQYLYLMVFLPQISHAYKYLNVFNHSSVTWWECSVNIMSLEELNWHLFLIFIIIIIYLFYHYFYCYLVVVYKYNLFYFFLFLLFCIIIYYNNLH